MILLMMIDGHTNFSIDDVTGSVPALASETCLAQVPVVLQSGASISPVHQKGGLAEVVVHLPDAIVHVANYLQKVTFN